MGKMLMFAVPCIRRFVSSALNRAEGLDTTEGSVLLEEPARRKVGDQVPTTVDGTRVGLLVTRLEELIPELVLEDLVFGWMLMPQRSFIRATSVAFRGKSEAGRIRSVGYLRQRPVRPGSSSSACPDGHAS